jgi:hypothetical protein
MNTRGHEVIWNCTSKLDLLIYMVVHGCLRNNRCKFERFPEQTTSWQWHWNKVNGNWMKYDESKAIEMHWVPAKLKSTYRPPAHEPSTLINPHQPFGSVDVGRTFSFPLQSSQASRHRLHRLHSDSNIIPSGSIATKRDKTNSWVLTCLDIIW